MDPSQSSSWGSAWSWHERPQSRSGDAWSWDERPQSRSGDNALWWQRSWWSSGEHGAAKRTWGNDNGPQSRTESAPPGTDWSTEPAWGAQAPQTVGWANPATDNPATHTETAEPKEYQISIPREGTVERQWTSERAASTTESTAAVSDSTGYLPYRGGDIRYRGHCKSATVMDHAAGSAVADQKAPSPVADQAVGSAVADHKAPSPVADQAVGSAVAGQNAPPPEAAAGCKAAALLTIINNKQPPPSVPPPHTTAQAQIRVQPPGHESKEKKRRLLYRTVWLACQTTPPFGLACQRLRPK